MNGVHNSLKGAGAALVSSFLITVIFANVFRVPNPLGGYIGPFGEINPYTLNMLDVLSGISMAWLAYGLVGGFIILPILGGITGLVIGKIYCYKPAKNKMIVAASTASSIVLIFVLSILDYLIGPW